RPAPTFKCAAVVDGLFQDVALSDYVGQWYAILHLLFLTLDAFKAIDTTVLGPFTFRLGDTARKEGGLGPDLKLPLIADKNMSIARDYGVLLEDEGVALRGLFIIDPKGILRQITVNDLPVGRSVEETLRLVKAFQFTDKHGEVCPANWQEGGETMKADPKGSKEYFSAH
ncbi:peroxiredoxin, partial [Mucidula mucida]